jgi:WD40 repeat protein
MSRVIIVCGCFLMLAARGPAQQPVILKEPAGWIGAVTFSSFVNHLVVGSSDGSVSLWDVAARKKLFPLYKHRDAVAALAFSSDGLLVSGAHDGIVYLRGEDFRGDFQIHRGALLAAAFSPDSKRLFTGGIDATVKAIDLGRREAKPTEYRGHTSWVNSLAINRAGTMIASASSDNTIRVRRLADDMILNLFRVNEGEIRSVAFSPDGKLIAAGIRYGHVRLWDLEKNKEVVSFKPFTGETWAVAFTPDGKTLFAGGGDWHKPSEVRRWEVDTWKELAPLAHTGEVLCLSISPDGRWLAAGSWDRTVRVWKLKP